MPSIRYVYVFVSLYPSPLTRSPRASAADCRAVRPVIAGSPLFNGSLIPAGNPSVSTRWAALFKARFLWDTIANQKIAGPVLDRSILVKRRRYDGSSISDVGLQEPCGL